MLMDIRRTFMHILHSMRCPCRLFPRAMDGSITVPEIMFMERLTGGYCDDMRQLLPFQNECDTSCYDREFKRIKSASSRTELIFDLSEMHLLQSEVMQLELMACS